MTDAVATLGHNGGPDLTFDALKVNADDLLDQARTITTVTTADQLEAVKALESDLREAGAELEKLRVERKAPHDEAITAIQDQFNPYLAPLTNKTVKGKIPLALDALKRSKDAYLLEQDRIRKEEARKAQEAADAAAKAAADALRAASGEDMEAREEAEVLVVQAQAMARNAARAETAASKGTGLRSSWVADLADPMAALKHYMATAPEDLKAWLNDMARKDVFSGKRTIPGFTVTEQRKAA